MGSIQAQPYGGLGYIHPEYVKWGYTINTYLNEIIQQPVIQQLVIPKP